MQKKVCCVIFSNTKFLQGSCCLLNFSWFKYYVGALCCEKKYFQFLNFFASIIFLLHYSKSKIQERAQSFYRVNCVRLAIPYAIYKPCMPLRSEFPRNRRFRIFIQEHKHYSREDSPSCDPFCWWIDPSVGGVPSRNALCSVIFLANNYIILV